MDLKVFALMAVLLCANVRPAHASLGQTEIPATPTDGPVTLYYLSRDAERPLKRGRMVLNLAANGQPVAGNGRLVVISHGSGGSPWVHADLARALTEAGFIIALPEHREDNYRDGRNPGPDSWTLRPGEVSRAIDTVSRDARFSPLLRLDKVGLYGVSAGGHTALSLAGGQWSPARFKRHCETYLTEDFQACVGLAAQLTGGMLDGPKREIALMVIRRRFSDERLRSDFDPRIAAVVAGVPTAADFDPDSLIQPRVPLALITANQDRWQIPKFQSDPVLGVCKSCEHLLDLPGSHGALLSPLPPGLTGLLGKMLNDPPGYDRERETALVNGKVTEFFAVHLLP
jgi:predicted dienelactone hydrolase